MDKVIKQISEIEAAATAVMDDANVRKKAFAQEMEERTHAFDKELDDQTEQQIRELRGKMELEMGEKLARQRTNSEQTLQLMEANYCEHHTEYATHLFRSLVEE